MNWNEEALLELEKVPEHVREMAKSGIEKRAKELEVETITKEIVVQIKEKYFSFMGKGNKDQDGEKKTINVAIIRCDIVSEVCPGSGCLKAFNNRKVHFEQYGPEANLIGFFTCGGCSGRRAVRLVQNLKKNNDLDVVHLSSCMMFDGNYPKCQFRDGIKNCIELKGVKVVEGSHH